MLREKDNKQNFKANKFISNSNSSKPSSVVTCYSCGKKGHKARECRSKPRASFKPTQKAACAVHDDGASKACLCHTVIDQNQDLSEAKLMLKSGEHLPLVGLVCDKARKLGLNFPIVDGVVNGITVGTLRDTGCSGVVVKKDLVSSEQFIGKQIACILIDGTVRRFPIAEISIDTPYYQGIVEAMCMDQPVYDLIIGNIPGVRSISCSDLKKVEVQDKSTNVAEVKADIECSDSSEVASVVTRAQAKQQNKPLSPLRVASETEISLGECDLKELQKQDKSLAKYWELAKEGKGVSHRGSSGVFEIRKGLLYRKYQSPKVASGNEISQVVVPTELRSRVMRVAHDSIMGGHLGSGKTSDRILSQFYWPNLHTDVARYCRSCDVCQRTIPKGRVGKVPLQKMPVIDEPFKRVAVDLVGPIKPVTDKGNRYILVLVDYATRYPEAVALPSIQTEVVAEALVSMYSRLGIPEEILSDHGTQFVSELMKEVQRLLSIKAMTSSVYHPQCNGLVEKFNGTLKQMLRKMCAERPKDWDRYIDALLFAYREAPQDSLGFAPFELLYGRSVRGPMSILKELWVKENLDTEVRNTYQYVLELRDRLEHSVALASEHLQNAQHKQKHYYDRKTRKREFRDGDKVLVLLPTDSNKLLMQWKGPYVVECAKNRVDYRVNMNGVLRTFHINLLKQYVDREEGSLQTDHSACNDVDLSQVASVAIIEDNENGSELGEDITVAPLHETENYKEVVINPNLGEKHRQQLLGLVEEFKEIFTDRPGTSVNCEHSIALTSQDPVKQRPYSVPFIFKDKVKKEVGLMLDLGVIEHSDAAYASPVVLVKKKDGTIRFCVDYRRLNRITLFDTEPMPNTEEVFARIHDKRFFSKLDLSKGYWQIPIKPECRDATTFVCSEGSFRYLKMPFGLVNAPATLNRLMRRLLNDIHDADCYMDDVLGASVTWEEHLSMLRPVLSRIKLVGLTLRPSKCLLGFGSLDFVGHVVGEGNLSPHPDTVAKIRKAKIPETKKQVRSFLGLVGFYRRYIPNFSSVAAPLTDLTKKGKPNKVEWGFVQDSAFSMLKEILSKAPVLRLTDFSKPFILQTDASEDGIGAVLYQQFEDGKFPISYVSRKLLPREKAYAVVEKECLALIWAVKKFQSYLYGVEFVVETDHQPLVYINRTKHENSRVMRWALSLQPYRFRICSIKGQDNVGADYLSRSTGA